MFEPDVALTDFAIALACAVFCALLLRRTRDDARTAFIWLFALTGAGAVLGGIVHGFFDVRSPDPVTDRLWLATMLLAGAAGSAVWLIVAALVLPARARFAARLLIAAEWLAYAAWAVWMDRSFLVVVVQYSAPALALLVVLGVRFVRRRHVVPALGAGAILLTFAAGALQQAGWSPTRALTHNAFFHVLQLIALAGLFLAARRIDEVH
ncbi:MAG TPA: hypothetical protein VKZ85_18350 [Woeseiaceae bacterium]|nr:hypothetical protein [Woeseiaceae bacterium]